MENNRVPLSFLPVEAPGSFKANELLTADKLNAALQSAVNSAFLVASAPPCSGIYHPWWWSREANYVGLGGDDNSIAVRDMFVSLESGTPLFIEHAEVKFVVDGAGVFLTSAGTLEQNVKGDGENGRELMRIATHRRGKKPRIDVPVAALVATKEIRAASQRVCATAGEWFRRAVEANQQFDFIEDLAFLRNGDAVPERQVRKLAEVAASVRRHLGKSSGANVVPPELDDLVRAPESLGHDALCTWLTTWTEIFESEALLRCFFDPEALLEPQVLPGRFTDGSWYKFDISSSNAEEMELLASKTLEQARVSFNKPDKRKAIPEMKKISEGRYSVLLTRPPNSTVLYVFADHGHLRLRLLTPRGN